MRGRKRDWLALHWDRRDFLAVDKLYIPDLFFRRRMLRFRPGPRGSRGTSLVRVKLGTQVNR